MRFAALLLASFALVSVPAFAGKIAGKSFPDTASVGGKTLQLNGMGLRKATVFKVQVYAAGLYVEEKSKDATALLKHPGPKKIVLKFVRGVGKDDLTGAWTDGFENNAGADAAAAKAGLAQLNGYMQDLEKHAEMSFTYTPGKGTTVTINGKVKGTIPGEAFSRAMFACFIGPNPPNKELKSGLLGD